MSRSTEPRLLRAFVTVAEELHFTRAAGRLLVAQQALSRDIRRLESEWGRDLFRRSTRRVALTAEGERLLPYARRVLTAHDELAAEVGGDGRSRPFLVDVGAPVSTGRRVLDAAREAAPELEFVARFHGGLSGAATELLDGRLDASFGYVAGLPAPLRSGLGELLVRYERVAVLLPAGHRLAGASEVALGDLAGQTLYAGAGNQDTAEWTEFARELFAGYDIHLAPPYPRIEGDEEFARVVRRHRWSVLAAEEFAELPDMVLRPLTAPVALSPVSLVWPAGLRHPALTALRTAAAALGAEAGWTRRPRDSWVPAAHRRGRPA